MIINLFLVYSSIIGDFIRDSQSFAAGMPTSDSDTQIESNGGSNAPNPLKYSTWKVLLSFRPDVKTWLPAMGTECVWRFQASRGLRIARTTREGHSWRERVWRAVRLGTQQVKLRGNRRGEALRMNLVMSTAQRYQDPVISQHRKIIPLQCHIFSRSRAFASPVLGKRNCRDVV